MTYVCTSGDHVIVCVDGVDRVFVPVENPTELFERRGVAAVCWLCGGAGADTPISVGRETPGGAKCKVKKVAVHNGCYMDMAT